MSEKIMPWFMVILWMGAIFYFSSIPGKNIPAIFPFQDVVLHIFVYAILGFFFAAALKNNFTGVTLLKSIIFVVIFGFLYGLSDEWHQGFVPGRTVSGIDVFFDVLGSLAGGWLRNGRNKTV